MMAEDAILGSRGKVVCLCAMLLLALASPSAADTVVRFQTVMGDFYVQLYDTVTPITVGNFLNYVNSGRYANSFFHRLSPGFVLQGGGFTYDGTIASVSSFGPIQNEFDPLRSNLRGTLAMAKLGGDPDSATSQFFVNLGDNSANLDTQNGGFTVFGEVMGNGMLVVDALASVQTFPFASPFNEIPLRNYTMEQFNDFANNPVGTDNFEMFDVMPALPGDVDGDGYVGADDLVTVLTNWAQPNMSRGQGDVTGDTYVGADDYVEVLTYWGTSTPTEAMPEPATLGLVVLGGLALLRRRRM